MKKYKTCVKALEKQGLTRRQIAGLVGVDEAVISRRMRDGRDGGPTSKPTVEALIVINILAEVFSEEFFEAKTITFDEKGWLQHKINVASQLHSLGPAFLPSGTKIA
jgi:transcriptional regulator with XRE-family HTH domain